MIESLKQQLRRYDPNICILRNQDGRWYIGRSKAYKTRLSEFRASLNMGGTIHKDKIHEYLKEALKGSPELTLVNAILSNSEASWDYVTFRFGNLPSDIAALFNPSDNSIIISSNFQT